MMRSVVLGAGVVLIALPAWAYDANLSWVDNASGAASETGVEVERRLGDATSTAPWVKIATTPTNAIAYQDVGLVQGQGYCWRVRAINTGGASAYSNVVCKASPLPPPPPAPTNFDVVPVIVSQP